MLRKTYLILAVFTGLASLLLAQEQITITTYYPSPFGSYREVVISQRVAIGNVDGSADGVSDVNDMAVDGAGNPIPGSLTVERRVGIGTNTPLGILEALAVNPANNLGDDIIMTSYSNLFVPGFVTQRARGTPSAPQPVVANDFLGGFVFRGHDGTGFQTVGGMDMKAENNFGPATHTAALNFKTTDGLAYSTKMTIAGNGNVGIGTTTPGSLLHVVSSAPNLPLHIVSPGVQPELLLQDTAVGHAAQIRFQNVQRTWELGGDAAPDLFYINQAGGAQDIFVIDPTGNVGIGTVTPQARLDVAGNGATMMVPRKTTAGDPAGVNGMIYYNSNLNKFRVYENGAWADLIAGGGGGGGGWVACAWTPWSICTAWQTSNELYCPAGDVVTGYQRQGCSSAVVPCADTTRCERVRLYCCH